MDYAVQLLVILVLFTAGGVWLHDHWGWPKFVIAIAVVLGAVAGVTVMMMRLNREHPSKPIDLSKVKPYVEDDAETTQEKDE